MWYVYMLECADGSFYTGITVDVEKRLQEHNENNRLGAKYTRARRPVRVVYVESVEDRSLASRREHELKQLTRAQKESLVHVN